MAAPVRMQHPSIYPGAPWRPGRAAHLRHGRGGCGVQPRVQRGQAHAFQGVQPPRHRLRWASPRDRQPHTGSMARVGGPSLAHGTRNRSHIYRLDTGLRACACQLDSQAKHAAGRPRAAQRRLCAPADRDLRRPSQTYPQQRCASSRARVQNGRACSVAVAPARLSCTPFSAAPSAAAAARSAPRPACSAPSACCPGSASWNARASAARSPAAYAAASCRSRAADGRAAAATVEPPRLVCDRAGSAKSGQRGICGACVCAAQAVKVERLCSP